MRVVLFHDERPMLGPLVDLRPSFEIRTGVLTTRERAARRVGVHGLLVPTALEAITRERAAGVPVNRDIAAGEAILLNGRAPLAWKLASDGLAPGEAIVDPESGDLVAARADVDDVRNAEVHHPGVARGRHVSEADPARLIGRPWHVRRHRDACITDDLALLSSGATTSPLPAGVVRIGAHPIVVAASARIMPGVILDASDGPIVIDESAVVRPGAILVGPCAIGPCSTALDRVVIRPWTVLGPWCKAAGEVSGTIFQGYSNKAHDGFLGDSYLGEWVNLGAGTTNSNLLNTYGMVVSRATPDAPNERTGEQFLGSVIGDHAKTAIGTRIMTGAVVGAGTMWAATAPISGTIRAFTWSTDAGVRAFRFEKFVESARAAMARRGMTPSPAAIASWHACHQRANPSGREDPE